MLWEKSKLKWLVFALLIVVICGMTGCGSQTFKFLWLSSNLKTENLPNWNTIPVYRMQDIGGSMAVVNDSARVYLRFYVHGKRLLRRLENRGLTVQFRNPDNQAARFAVHFPLGMEMERRHLDMAPERPRNFEPDSMPMPPPFRNDKFELSFGDSVLSEQESLELAGQLHLFPSLDETKEGNAEYILGLDFNSKLPWIQPGSKIIVDVDAPAEDRSEFRERRPPREGQGGEGGSPWGGGGQGRGGRGHRGGGGGRQRGEQGSDEKRAEEGIPNNQKIHFTFTGQLAANATP